MKKYVIQGCLAIPALCTCRAFYCLLHRVCLFIDHKSLEWRFYSSTRVSLSMFSLSCQSAPPPPTPHMPELGDRRTGQLNHMGLNVKAYPFILSPLSQSFEWAIVWKRGNVKKSIDHCRLRLIVFSLPSASHAILYFLLALSVWYRPEPKSLRRHLWNAKWFPGESAWPFFTPVCRR